CREPDREKYKYLLSCFRESSMALIIRCEACNRRLKVQDEMAGKLIKCPSCGGKTKVTPAETSTDKLDDKVIASSLSGGHQLSSEEAPAEETAPASDPAPVKPAPAPSPLPAPAAAASMDPETLYLLGLAVVP